MKRMLIWIICLLLGVAYAASRVPESPRDPAHYHIDLKIYIHGKPVDLTQEKYQSSDESVSSNLIHLHDGNGNVVHFHQTGLNLHNLLLSLDGDLTPNCLYFDGQKYCTGFTSSLKVFVNSKRQLLPHRYEPKDEDKILISFGPHIDPQIEKQLLSVSSDACIYSLKCPERGQPEVESCVGNSTDPCVLPGTQ